MAVEDLCPLSSEICTVPNSESPEPDVELGCSRKKKKNKKKRCKLESNDKSCESPSLQSQFVQLSDQEAPQPLTEKSNTIADSENPQSNVEPSLSTKKKKKKKGSRTTETNDTSCESPSQQPQLVQLSDQQAPQPLAEKITTIADSESRQSNVELSLSQNKKKKKNKRKNKKGCKTPETNDKSCESPSIQPQLVQATDQEVEVPQRIEAVQPQLAQVTDQKLEVPQPIEDLSFSVKNKKRNGKKSRKPHDCNDEVCGVSVGTSVMESKMPAVDPYIKPSVEISLEQLVAEPLVEGMSTTANSKSPKPNADFGCSQEMKKKKRKRSHKTSEYKELLVETMMPEADPSFQPSIAMFSEQEVEVSQPLNVDAESLVEGMSTTINSERPSPNADFNCSQESKKKKRKRGHKTSDSKEVLVEPMLPEAESSLRPSLTMLSEQELDVPQPLNADAEPLVEGMSTTINSESTRGNADFTCSQETKKKKRKRGSKTSDSKELLVEVVTPEADPSLQPLLAIFSEHELEVPPPLTTDAEPLVEGMSVTMNSESLKPNADISCLEETKKKNSKRKCKTSVSKKLSVEIMMPEPDPSLQPTLSEKELEVPQPLNTDAEPLVEGMSTTMNSESPKPNADFVCPQETKKKNRKRKHKTSESKELLVEIMAPEEDPSLQPTLSEKELQVPPPLNTDAEPLVEGMSTTINLESTRGNADFTCSQETKKKKRKRGSKTSDSKELLVEVVTPEADPSLQPLLAIFSEHELEVPPPLTTDAEPLVEGMSVTMNSESLKPNADISCLEETKKQNSKRKCKTSVSKKLSVEIMMPEPDPSLQPTLSEKELEVPQPLNTDAEPLVEGMSTTMNSESPKPNADFVCPQETKKKNRKRKHKTSESKELLVEIMAPEEDPSLQPTLSEKELQVPPPLNTDAEPLVEGMSTTINLESTRGNADFTCSQETKKKKQKRGSKTSEHKELLVEIMTPETDPSLQPSLAIISEHEVEVPQPRNTDAQPLVEGVSTTNSESPKPNAEFSCSQETKKKNPKRNRETNENKELLVETMTPEADLSLQPPLAIFSEQELEVAQPLNTGTVWKETKIDEVPSLSHLTPKADTEVVAIGREGNLSQKKLLILDINGLLADIVQMEVSIPSSFKPDTIISRKAVFKRPFCDDFLQFCFDRFNVGVWSSRTKENVNSVIDFLLGDSKHKLLFCWNQSHCTSTSFKTVENKNKPLVLKELRKLWEKLEPDLPWARGEYNESNTVLLDDSPYKALRNPVNTAIFPNSYQFRNRKDSSLGPGGDIRSYLEGLAMAESAQKYVEQNPFGQRPITKSNPSWNFYRRVIEDVKPLR